jgi:hypothetical protein
MAPEPAAQMPQSAVQPEPPIPEPGPDPLPRLFDLVDDDRTVVLVWSDSVDVRNEWPFYEQAVYAKVNPAVARRICRNRKSPLTRIRNLFQSI